MTSGASGAGPTLLDVRNLTVRFKTRDGIVQAARSGSGSVV